MSERVSAVSIDQHQHQHQHQHQQKQKHLSCCYCLKSTFKESLLIFAGNKQTFISIFALLALPLSFLHFSLSLSSLPIQSHILQLHSLAALSHTRFEARQVWKECRDDALLLLRRRLLYYFLPSFSLSLLAAVAAVSSADAAYQRGLPPPTLSTALAAVRRTWPRPLVTSICNYALLWLYSGALRTAAAAAAESGPLVWALGWGLEVYLMAVAALALVVSVLEARFGWEAVRVGSALMEGRRVCGWVISGLLVAVTGWIGSRVAMDAQDWSRKSRSEWTMVMVMETWEGVGLVVLYGVVVMWGFVLTTVYYCECRKRHVVKEDEEDAKDDADEVVVDS